MKAIVEMPPPNCKKQVQSFIDRVNYPFKFSACLSELAEPIWEMSKEKVPFNAPILAYYNPRKSTVLQTDVSIKGLEACLLQDERPVYFASKALTEAQRGYIVIELESFAVAWAMEKFHHFLHAKHFILETDQRPLETILSRNLNQATPYLQRIVIRTFPFNFTVRYLPGLKNQLADCLSYVGGLQDSFKLPNLSVYQITSQLNARSNSLQQIREATQADDTLAILKYTIQQGWPNSIKEVPSEIQPFWTFCEELTIDDGLILKGIRIVIPNRKQDDVLKLIHEGHLGLTKWKLKAKEAVYHPGLNEQLEQLILNCQLCLKYSQSKHKQPLHMSLGQEIPIHPWTKLAMIYFTLKGNPTCCL